MSSESGAAQAAEDLFSFIVGNNTDSYRMEYDPANAVQSFHVLPRFSHSNDFSLLFSDDGDDVRDYSLGLLFIACLIMSFFTVWLLIVWLFKCIGPRYLGVFSGHPYQQPGLFADIGRVVFGVSALVVMIFSIITVTKGLSEVQNSADTIEATNNDALKIHDEFVKISNSLKSVAGDATPVRDELVEFLKQDICPLSPGSIFEDDVRRIGSSTLGAMEQLSNFIEDNLHEVDAALVQVQRASSDIDTAVDKISFHGGIAATIMIPYFIVPALLLVALFLGFYEIYHEKYYLFTTWFLTPLFILMIVFAYSALGFAVLSTEANADFCSGNPSDTPEDTINNILGQYNLAAGDLYYDTVTFYASQCTEAGPWDFLEGYYRDLFAAKEILDAFADAVVDRTPEQLSQECGVEYGPVLQLLNQLQAYMDILLDSAFRSMELMSCESVVPLYTSSIYEGLCDESIMGGTWIYASFFVISFFAMTMLMFRGAVYPIDYFEGKALEYGTSEDDAGLEEESGDSMEEYTETIEGEEVVYDDSTEQKEDEDGELVPYQQDGSMEEESYVSYNKH